MLVLSNDDSTTRAVAFILFASLLWSSSGPIGRTATEAGVSATGVAAARLSVAAFVLAPFAFALLRAAFRGHLSRRQVVAVVASGGSLALYQTMYFAAVERAGITVSTLIALGGTPVFVALGSTLIGDDRPDRRVWGLLVFSIAGVALLTGGTSGGGPDPVFGALLAVLSAAGFAGVTLLGRWLAGVPPLPVVATQMVVAALVLSPALASVRDASSATIWSLVLLGLGPTALAYTIFLRGVAVVPAARASLLTLAEPASANALAAVFFGERIGLAAGAGIVLIVTSTILGARGVPSNDEPVPTSDTTPDREVEPND